MRQNDKTCKKVLQQKKKKRRTIQEENVPKEIEEFTSNKCFTLQ